MSAIDTIRRACHRLAHRLGLTSGLVVVYDEDGHRWVAHQCVTCGKRSHRSHAAVCDCHFVWRSGVLDDMEHDADWSGDS